MQRVDWVGLAADLGECLILHKIYYGSDSLCLTEDGMIKLNCKLKRGWRTFPFYCDTALYWSDVRVKKGGGIIYRFDLPTGQTIKFSEHVTKVETTSPFSCFKIFDYHFRSVAKCTYDELINKYLVTEKTIIEMPPKLIEPEEQKLKIYDAMPDFGSW